MRARQATVASLGIVCAIATCAACTDWERFSRDLDKTQSCATYVVVGDVHSCARTSNGTLFCWGDNRFGQLGIGDTSARDAPVVVDFSGLGALRVYLPTGNGDLTSDLTAFTCAIASDDDLWCWGDNRFGQLGLGPGGGAQPAPGPSRPAKVGGLSGKPSKVTNGAGHTCVQMLDGALSCFGRNTQGQLGMGDRDPRTSPSRVDVGRPVERLAAGAEFTCARTNDAVLFCWGANASGQLGLDNTDAQLRPAEVKALGARVGRFATGAAHACAFTEDDGKVHCWGEALFIVSPIGRSSMSA